MILLSLLLTGCIGNEEPTVDDPADGLTDNARDASTGSTADGHVPRCAIEASEPCHCSDGNAGERTCGADGLFGLCECGGGLDAAGAGGADGSFGDAGGQIVDASTGGADSMADVGSIGGRSEMDAGGLAGAGGGGADAGEAAGGHDEVDAGGLAGAGGQGGAGGSGEADSGGIAGAGGSGGAAGSGGLGGGGGGAAGGGQGGIGGAAGSGGLGGIAGEGGAGGIGGSAGSGGAMAADCEVGARQRRFCGLNGRSEQVRHCLEGQWSAWGDCEDLDVCVDDATDTRPCADNDAVSERRRCIAGQWAPWVGCESPECVDRAIQRRACGLNGNGTASRICNAGYFDPWSPCEDPDECVDGESEAQICGLADNGTRTRGCVHGRWAAWSGCDGPDRVCEDGVLEEAPCGLNLRAWHNRVCVGGRWGAYSECVDPDTCVDDAIAQRPCGLNEHGLLARTCTEGQWEAWGDCADPDACVDGAEAQDACGINGAGARIRACLGGQWTEWSVCEDPDVCRNGGHEIDPQPCGLNANGTRARECIAGQWGDWRRCSRRDECRNDEHESRRCGVSGNSERRRMCVDGTWSVWAPCDAEALCPDLGNPECGPPRAEICNGIDDDHDGEIDEGLVAVDGVLPAPNPFELAVEAAIDHGLDSLRGTEAGRGIFTPEEGASHNGIAVLCFLEQRSEVGRGEPVGYRGLHLDDQALVRRALQRAIDESDDAMTHADAAPSVYIVGSNLMALAAYLRTGGPDDLGAQVTATQAVSNAVEAMTRVQAQRPPHNAGGWNYSTPQENADLSTTHFAASGLAAAASVFEGADLPIQAVPSFLTAVQRDDGGLAYNSRVASSSSMTAAGLWLYRLAGAPASVVGGPARALQWLDDRYTWSTMHGPYAETSQYYYQWALIKALGAQRDDVDLRRFAGIVPTAAGYPDARPGHFFDVASTLLSWQGPDGAWGREDSDAPRGWDQPSSHMFALLTLERSTGGVPEVGDAPYAISECSDGVDNDRDGQIDGLDADCPLACVTRERPRAACDNGLDDDADGYVDSPSDPGCVDRYDDDETNPACSNQVDDDGDGYTDWPADPGCHARHDADETDPRRRSVCSNGFDEDGDGREDFGEDPDCYTADHNLEGGNLACPPDVSVEVIRPRMSRVQGTTVDGGNDFRGACGGIRGRERVYALLVDRPSRITLSTANDLTLFDTVLYVRESCQVGAVDLVCNDDLTEGNPLSVVTWEAPEPGVFFIFVDGQIDAGEFALEIDRAALRLACGNAIDDDHDGLVDREDPGCSSPADRNEADPEPPPACYNGLDDDGDGAIDYGADQGCTRAGDEDEANPPTPPACADGEDNDADGRVDWPWDASCPASGHDSEFGPPQACDDGFDNDADGRIDYPFDAGCVYPSDAREEDPEEMPACDDGRDNDADGTTDFPNEPGCVSAADNDETDGLPVPVCANTVDDDEDGRTDYPDDPGCAYAADHDETDGSLSPSCADGRDNDGDGRVDYPDDLGCMAAVDRSEAGDPSPPPRCRDQRDNDMDGQTDAADPGCETAEDDDETDPPEVPQCASGRDEDGDGLRDWPDDPGCRAAGDRSESQACRAEVSIVDLAVDEVITGETIEGEPDHYRNICGGTDQPEAVYRYLLPEPATLVISADHEGTTFPMSLSVRRDCEEPDAELVCAQTVGDQGPTVRIEDAQPGEYFILVDGAAPPLLRSAGAPIDLPADPRGFVATHDVMDGACWADGGWDAFDCYGRLGISHNGEDLWVDISEGEHQHEVGTANIRVRSDFPHANVWRLRVDSELDTPPDELFTLVFTGDLGSDNRTIAETRQFEHQGTVISYLYAMDNRFPVGGPSVLTLMVPATSHDVPRVEYTTEGDDVLVEAADVPLPVVIYVAIGFTDIDARARAIAQDILPEGPSWDTPRFGAFELSVRTEP